MKSRMSCLESGKKRFLANLETIGNKIHCLKFLQDEEFSSNKIETKFDSKDLSISY